MSRTPEQLIIRGGQTLQGEVTISGAKNAALPLLCAALLTDEPIVLRNVPRLQDVRTMLQLLSHMGVQTRHDADGTVHLHAQSLGQPEAPYDLVRSMRASILALGPLMARIGYAKVALPGGCAIGSRPVDQHIRGLQAMGAETVIEHGNIIATLPHDAERLQGARITTDMVTVTGTENLLMAAVLAEGETILANAAQEPEIIDLAEMLIAMGARIEGHGTGIIRIQGVERLHGCDHSVVADRIEAGTFLCAVAATGGDVLLKGARGKHLGAVLEKLRDMGVSIECLDTGIRVSSPGAASGKLLAQSLRTTEYPGFPTDMQAQFMALNCVVQGPSTIAETIFENRFMHVSELIRLGARIQTDGKVAVVEGGALLSGAEVSSTDLRASACLVIAGLVAQGQTCVSELHHLDRGYDNIEAKLRSLGANIERHQACAAS
ncbi:UDP-N-acetylglucosamine 1-carboxyvinyltransferase [Lampropedia aestuarii]|uniref:UDP-N-acetylglucosamine 1-carboxyvinyltransferase n=1 Tax=Lampropedia aestuarii TaxID=2562762 RepID=A0A4S5BX87_9BURK|nr:UDP-N-acetylglucosamine 1-carboxyvinyltransferase [Lampropedia aestuarii]THJ36053.1 UDP-N-acetylglucosamine 1-carboxyvinyltransferase [Lampropedia aestuarii]